MQNLVVCQRRPKCNVSFVKKDGIPKLNKWFCSEKCIELDLGQDLENVVEEEVGDSDSDIEIDL